MANILGLAKPAKRCLPMRRCVASSYLSASLVLMSPGIKALTRTLCSPNSTAMARGIPISAVFCVEYNASPSSGSSAAIEAPLPEGTTREGWDRVECQPLTAEEVAQALQAVPADPHMRPGDEAPAFRISLASAQDKTAFIQVGGQWCRPLGVTPSTHIFKLPLGVTANTSRVEMFDAVENEWLCRLREKRMAVRPDHRRTRPTNGPRRNCQLRRPARTDSGPFRPGMDGRRQMDCSAA